MVSISVSPPSNNNSAKSIGWQVAAMKRQNQTEGFGSQLAQWVNDTYSVLQLANKSLSKDLWVAFFSVNYTLKLGETQGLIYILLFFFYKFIRLLYLYDLLLNYIEFT